MMQQKNPYYLNSYLLDPIIPTVLTAGLAATGILFGFYPSDIGNSFPFVWPGWNSWSTFSWPACFSWLVFVATVVLFHFHNGARSAAARADHGEVLRQIKIMPPHNFLTIFRSYFETVYPAFKVASTSPKPEVVEGAIRSILRCIGGLAKLFERDENIYGVNIMLYYETSQLDTNEKEILSNRLLFSDDTSTIDGYEGVVDLQPTLTITTSGEGAEPDPAQKSMALPIPRTGVVDAGPGFVFERVLPGAPYAVYAKVPQAFPDTKKLAAWCNTEVDVSKQVVQQIHDHFSGPAGDTVRSFISIPLVYSAESDGDSSTGVERSGDEEDAKLVLAVLNIHSNEPGLLSDEGEPLDVFTEVIGPFNLLIVELLQKLKKLTPNLIKT